MFWRLGWKPVGQVLQAFIATARLNKIGAAGDLFLGQIGVAAAPDAHRPDLDLWAYQRGIVLDFSCPGKPTDNAFIEAFNCRLRVECLNAHWFLTIADAREKLERWRSFYNEERPHGAIGYKTPIELMNGSGASGPPA